MLKKSPAPFGKRVDDDRREDGNFFIADSASALFETYANDEIFRGKLGEKYSRAIIMVNYRMINQKRRLHRASTKLYRHRLVQ